MMTDSKYNNTVVGIIVMLMLISLVPFFILPPYRIFTPVGVLISFAYGILGGLLNEYVVKDYLPCVYHDYD